MKLHAPTVKAAVEFGTLLVQTQDLDPIYTAINGVKLKDATLHRMLVAYWCLYHLGVSAFIAEKSRSDSEFWENLMVAAVNKGLKWPRGSERRHWRGEQATKSARELAQRYQSTLELIDHWSAEPTFHGVTQCVQSNRGFGPWIAFKVADMLERVLHVPVDFSTCELGFYSEPLKGAFLLKDGFLLDTQPSGEHGASVVREVVKQLLASSFGQLKAPPDRKRKVNIQEIETLTCKYKSFYNGHYFVGKDITEVRHGLVGWGDLAQELLKHAPKEVLRD